MSESDTPENLKQAAQNLQEAQRLERMLFQQQGNPAEITLGPNDLATLFGFAVIAGRKMEGMPSGSLTEAVANDISNYSWQLAGACFQSCDPPAQSISVKDSEKAQSIDENLLVPLLSVAVAKGREMERGGRGFR